MKILLSCLYEHLETKATVTEITDGLNSLGLTVDEVIDTGAIYKNFCIVEVQNVTQHSNADKLKICSVNTGKEILQVVCGASNVTKGMKAVLARPGDIIPINNLILKKTKIRGVDSAGMLCSAYELKLSDTNDDDGILSLDDNAVTGMPYAQHMNLNDIIFDIEITPNRGDCLSITGIARELATKGIGKIKQNNVNTIVETVKSNKEICIADNAQNACPMFAIRRIQGVCNRESPLWLQRKLNTLGMRSISALVDITNYAMLMYGRPMHAFDNDKLNGNTIEIRYAKEKEKIIALDEQEYILNSSSLVISDNKNAISIAGIIGGLHSGCSMETTDVILESAFFEANTIASTGRKHNIVTESRYRFERGIDGAIILKCLDIATNLIIQICGGQASEIKQSSNKDIYEKAINKNRFIEFNPSLVKKLVNIDVDIKIVQNILNNLGFIVIKESLSNWRIKIPSWRHDIEGGADLVEEISRVIGYDSIITEPLPKIDNKNIEKSNITQDKLAINNKIRHFLASKGLCESQTWSFLSKNCANIFANEAENIHISNPISSDLSTMRPSLLCNLILAAQSNRNKGLLSSGLFEIGNVYGKNFTKLQNARVAVVRSGNFAPNNWLNKNRPVDFFDLKGDLWELLELLGINPNKLQFSNDLTNYDYLHPGKSTVVTMGKKDIAIIAHLHPKIMQTLDIEGNLYGFELFLDNLPHIQPKIAKRPYSIPKLQSIQRDLSFTLDQSISANDVIKIINSTSTLPLDNVEIVDVYQNKNIHNNCSISFRITIMQQDKTLTDAELNNWMYKIIAIVEQKTGGKLRS